MDSTVIGDEGDLEICGVLYGVFETNNSVILVLG